jgi:hypothetical protein
MTLANAAVLMGRTMSAAHFSESLRFYSVDGTTVDPDTLNDVETTTTLHLVSGRIKYPTLTVSERSAVGQTFSTQSVHAHVAVGATPNVHADHFVTVTASTADPALVGRTFRVRGNPQAGQVTAHRYPVEEVS